MIRAFITVLVLGGAALGALSFTNTLATVDVKTVRLAGDLTHAEGQEVQAAVASTLARPGFSGASDVVRAVEDLDWVRDVQVRRHWPDILHVSVSRQTLAARWGDDGELYLTTGGNVVALPPENREPLLRRLPVLKASHASSAEAMRLNTLLDEIAGTGNLTLDRLEQDETGNWIATVAGRVEVVLGNSSLGERFRRFLVVHQRALASEIARVARVDARYETGVAVRWLRTDPGDPGQVADRMDSTRAPLLARGEAPARRFAVGTPRLRAPLTRGEPLALPGLRAPLARGEPLALPRLRAP